MPKNTFLTKKNAPNVFIFYPRTQLVRLTTAVQGLGVPLREVPKTNPGYASAGLDGSKQYQNAEINYTGVKCGSESCEPNDRVRISIGLIGFALFQFRIFVSPESPPVQVRLTTVSWIREI